MKNLIPLLCAILLCSNIFSQDCSYSRNEKDEFTGERTTITRTKALYSAPFYHNGERYNNDWDYVQCLGIYENGTRYLVVALTLKYQFKILTGDLLYLKNDDKVVKLSCFKDSYATQGITGAPEYWIAQLVVKLDEEEIWKNLISNRFDRIRISFREIPSGRESHKDYNIKYEYRDNIASILKCINF